MTQQSRASFSDIADNFDYLFEDVQNLSYLEALTLNHILDQHNVRSVLDCACGTGIQSLGLARLGYQVSASDISQRMVQRLSEKAQAEGLVIPTRRADFRNLKAWRGATFDAVVCAGNSLTLVPQTGDIYQSLASMLRVTRSSGGVVVVGLHNYLKLKLEGEGFLVRQAVATENAGEVILDLRFFGTERVRITYMFIKLLNNRWRLRTYAKSYMCLSADDLRKAMLQVGFGSVRLLDISGQREFQDDEWALAVGVT